VQFFWLQQIDDGDCSKKHAHTTRNIHHHPSISIHSRYIITRSYLPRG